MIIAVEHAVAAYGTKTIPYRIERGRRRLTVAIVVDPEDGVILRAPPALPRDRIAAIVRRKGAWITQRLRRLEDFLPTPSPREFTSGETFTYLGRQYRLRIQHAPAAATPLVTLRGAYLHVLTPARHAQPPKIRAALKRWYRARAAAYLPSRLAHWSTKLEIPTPPLLIREPPKRWGSCDAKGNVRINWRTIQLAPRLIDYILAHELVHLDHPNHTPAFWSRLGTVLPDADQRRGTLRRAGARAIW